MSRQASFEATGLFTTTCSRLPTRAPPRRFAAKMEASVQLLTRASMAARSSSRCKTAGKHNLTTKRKLALGLAVSVAGVAPLQLTTTADFTSTLFEQDTAPPTGQRSTPRAGSGGEGGRQELVHRRSREEEPRPQ